MASRVILTPAQDITFGGFMFDATVREVFKAQSKITNYPVETGSNITDHVTQPPRELTLTGVITATPLDPDEQREMRIQDLFARLLVLQLSEEPLEVCSTFGFIPSMLITSMQATYAGADSGDMMNLSVNLKTITISESVRVLIAQTRIEEQLRRDWERAMRESELASDFAAKKAVFLFEAGQDANRRATRKILNETIFENPDVSFEQKGAAYVRIRNSRKYKGVLRNNEYFFEDGLQGNPDWGDC